LKFHEKEKQIMCSKKLWLAKVHILVEKVHRNFPLTLPLLPTYVSHN